MGMEFIDLTFLRVEEIATQTRAFFFSKPEGFSYKAGQYAMLRLPAERLVEPDIRSGMRPLSIASAPGDAELVFVMREGTTGFKQTMWDLKPGESILLGGPLGNATVSETDNRPVAILSGGVGVAPARSMLRDAVDRGDLRKYVLFYSNRTLPDAAFHSEISALNLHDFTYVWTLTKAETAPSEPGEERGYITADMIEKYLPEWQGALYYVIGAPAFADSMKAVLLAMGIAEGNIHMDPFAGLTGASSATKAS
ncbi:MAG: FAD-dependent oxidoreductase [Candidatus Moranbacteria bacterium]|nr:FAD-dependent oxidoreductase [Candidatus Moranbacteria bacterium]